MSDDPNKTIKTNRDGRQAAPRTVSPDRLIALEAAGGYVLHSDRVGHGYYGNVGIALQRDPHPQHGGGITSIEAKRRSTLWAASEELLAAAAACESVLMMAYGNSKAAREERELCLARLRDALKLARGEA